MPGSWDSYLLQAYIQAPESQPRAGSTPSLKLLAVQVCTCWGSSPWGSYQDLVVQDLRTCIRAGLRLLGFKPMGELLDYHQL